MSDMSITEVRMAMYARMDELASQSEGFDRLHPNDRALLKMTMTRLRSLEEACERVLEWAINDELCTGDSDDSARDFRVMMTKLLPDVAAELEAFWKAKGYSD